VVLAGYDRGKRSVLVADPLGVSHSIPFHRVREVWQDGRLIWERYPAGEPAA
jgi:uncharacterized protein (UPF0248 family)